MASTYKVLGQSRPASATNADLYTNPAGGQAVISTISITNTSDITENSVRIYVRKDGAQAAEGNALAYDLASPANTTTALTLGVTLDATDVLTVQSDNGDVTFQAFGLEIS